MARNRTKLGSFTFQIEKNLLSKNRIGFSKFEDRKNGIDSNQYIYSWSTFHAYIRNANYFSNWVKETHPQVKILTEARPFVEDWLRFRRDIKKDAAHTLKLKRSALAKLYDCHGEDFKIELPKRERKNNTRSRYPTKMDKHFSIKKNAELINFCRTTGLRRHELEELKGGMIIMIENKPHIHVLKGKGGKARLSPLIGSTEQIQAVVERINNTAPDKLVWGKVHKKADIHSFRKDYATKMYHLIARDTKTLPKTEQYFCRKELKELCLDRNALNQVSFALGHGKTEKPRPEIVVSNYFYI